MQVKKEIERDLLKIGLRLLEDSFSQNLKMKEIRKDNSGVTLESTIGEGKVFRTSVSNNRKINSLRIKTKDIEYWIGVTERESEVKLLHFVLSTKEKCNDLKVRPGSKFKLSQYGIKGEEIEVLNEIYKGVSEVDSIVR